MNKPLASILINNHNYGRFLAEAIDSALNQTYASVEVVVVDDGSTDESPDIIRGYGERIVGVIKGNEGQGSSVNIAFERSRGDYLFLLDSDDVFMPGKVAQAVEMFEQHRAIGWVFHPLRLRDAHSGSVLTEMIPPSRRGGLIDFRGRIHRGRQPLFAPATSGLCFRRDLLAKMLPMPVVGGTSADRYLKPMALALAPGYYINEVLAEQKIHGSNAHTLSPRRTQTAAKSMVLVAGWLRSRQPALRKLSIKMMAKGLGMYDASGGVDPEYADTVKQYLECSGPLERLSIAARRFYHGRIRRSEYAVAQAPPTARVAPAAGT